MKTQRYSEFLNRKSQGQARTCEHEGCQEDGLYRAPKDRRHLNLYIWLCLTHVRAYNADWDYYAGMDETELEQRRRADITWERPTWPMGRSIGAAFNAAAALNNPFKDPLSFFRAWQAQPKPMQEGVLDPNARFFSPQSAERRALLILKLREPTTFNQIKGVYRQLVKQYHPDAHQGCKLAEERIKKINNAYSILRKTYLS